MLRKRLKCLYCGRVAPPRAIRCSECLHELVDRGVWYIRYAPRIVGAALGALFGPFVVLSWRLWYVGVPDEAFTVFMASVPAGALIGAFAWDGMRRFIEDETAA